MTRSKRRIYSDPMRTNHRYGISDRALLGSSVRNAKSHSGHTSLRRRPGPTATVCDSLYAPWRQLNDTSARLTPLAEIEKMQDRCCRQPMSWGEALQSDRDIGSAQDLIEMRLHRASATCAATVPFDNFVPMPCRTARNARCGTTRYALRSRLWRVVARRFGFERTSCAYIMLVIQSAMFISPPDHAQFFRRV